MEALPPPFQVKKERKKKGRGKSLFSQEAIGSRRDSKGPRRKQERKKGVESTLGVVGFLPVLEPHCANGALSLAGSASSFHHGAGASTMALPTRFP